MISATLFYILSETTPLKSARMKFPVLSNLILVYRFKMFEKCAPPINSSLIESNFDMNEVFPLFSVFGVPIFKIKKYLFAPRISKMTSVSCLIVDPN
jgi:hypothetical protein